MKCKCIDINLLGIIISSCIICICIILSYFDCREPKYPKCNSIPTVEITNQTDKFHMIISDAIKESKNKINIAASGFSPTIYKKYYKHLLNEATSRGVKVTILICEHSKKELRSCLQKSKIKIISGNISMGFAVIDNISFMFNEILRDSSNSYSLLTTFFDCDIASNDMNTFFEYQVMKINNELPSIVPIKQHAKASVINPIYFVNQNSDNDQTLYFFHNPLNLGDPLRISTSNLIMSTMFLNSNESPKQNVSLFSDAIPPYTNYGFSFYQTFTRVLMANTMNSDNIKIFYLAPQSENVNFSSNWWLNTTAAFDNAIVNLYYEEYKGLNFIIVGDRAFVFSHSIDDCIVQYNLGFHYSTNAIKIVNYLSSFFNDVYSNHSVPYKILNKK